MTKTVGQNVNTNNIAELSGSIALNSSTSITIQEASEERVFWCITNQENFAIYVKFQPASIDDIKNGFKLEGKGYWEMPPGDKYTGEISAISESGTPEIFTTQY